MRPIARDERRPAPSRILRGAALAGALLAMANGCSGGRRATAPIASLALTTPAQTKLRDLIDEWGRSSRAERMAMKARIAAYQHQYSDEPPARTAEALLAWVTMEEGDFRRSEALAVAVTKRVPAGTTFDIARTVQGASLDRKSVV